MNRTKALELKLSGTDLGAIDKTNDRDSFPFTPDQKISIAMSLALELTLSQFLKERVFRDANDLRHFLMHFADFTARLNKGERILDPLYPQFSYKVESLGGDVAQFAIQDMLTMGEMKAPEQDEEQGEDAFSIDDLRGTVEEQAKGKPSDKSKLN